MDGVTQVYTIKLQVTPSKKEDTEEMMTQFYEINLSCLEAT